MRFGWCLLLSVLLGCPWLTPAAAAEAKYSRYEQETLDLALARHRGRVDPRPEGKIIEGIVVEVLDVIEPRDPAPGFLNYLHASSRDHVIRRELLVAEGERYDARLVAESERNLRELRQESVVIIVPLVGSKPDRVRLLVVAKDVWSLRLNWDLRLTSGGIETLKLQPAEENLFGTHRTVVAQLTYQPDTLAFGGGFLDRRLAGSRVLAYADANVIVNKDTGDVEGSFGSLQYGVPLYSTQQRWAWGAVVSWHREVTRLFSQGKLTTYPPGAEERNVVAIPNVWDTDRLEGRFSVTRSFGQGIKHNVTLGVEADRRAYRAPDLSGYPQAAADTFRRERVPRGDTKIGPFAQYHLYFDQYVELHDVETVGLQESFVTGPEAYARVYPVIEAFGSTRDLMGYHGELSHTVAHRGFVGRAYGAGTIEVTADHRTVYDASVHAGLRLVSPSFVVGRLVYDGTYFRHLENPLNRRLTLGGDTRLRGYPSALFLGENLIASNLELRSRALQVWTVLLAGALFYDVADAWDDDGVFRPKQGVGAGLRVLFPQLNRAVFRVDWGFALTPREVERVTGEPSSPLDGLVVTFRQAFALPRPTGSGVAVFPN